MLFLLYAMVILIISYFEIFSTIMALKKEQLSLLLKSYVMLLSLA